MSLDTYAKMYEKMLKNPENRKRSFMKQPLPGELDNIDTPVPEETSGPSDDDEAWIKEVDNRVSARKSGVVTIPPIVNEGVAQRQLEHAENRIVKLEKEINELKDLMTIMMKEHMKIIGKK